MSSSGTRDKESRVRSWVCFQHDRSGSLGYPTVGKGLRKGAVARFTSLRTPMQKLKYSHTPVALSRHWGDVMLREARDGSHYIVCIKYSDQFRLRIILKDSALAQTSLVVIQIELHISSRSQRPPAFSSCFTE